MTERAIDNFSVVLVDTVQPGNIGSAARALSNMGLRRLKLVNPREVLSSECLKMAGSAAEIVTGAEIYSSLQEAIAHDNIVVGTTSSRDRQAKQRFYTPSEIAPILLDYAVSNRIALVFGSEKRGLRDSELALCHYLVTIPADRDYPVLNLAQAVMILCYEVFSRTATTELNEYLTLAPNDKREQMFDHLQQTLLRIGFLSESNPAHIMDSIRRFLGRADLTERDIQIIRGILTQLEWFTREGHTLPPEKVRKP